MDIYLEVPIVGSEPSPLFADFFGLLVGQAVCSLLFVLVRSGFLMLLESRASAWLQGFGLVLEAFSLGPHSWFDHAQIHSITIWSTVDADAPDLLRMVTIDLGHDAFFTIGSFCFDAALEHAHACSSC